MRNLLVVAVALTLAAGAWADGPFRDSLDYAEGDPGPAIAEYQRVCDSLKARDRAIDSMLQDWREQQANTGVRLVRDSSHITIGRLLTDDDILVPRGDSLVWDSIIPDQLRQVVCTTFTDIKLVWTNLRDDTPDTSCWLTDISVIADTADERWPWNKRDTTGEVTLPLLNRTVQWRVTYFIKIDTIWVAPDGKTYREVSGDSVVGKVVKP